MSDSAKPFNSYVECGMKSRKFMEQNAPTPAEAKPG